MDTTLTTLFFTDDLTKHAIINFDKDIKPYNAFLDLPSFNQKHILDKTDRWLNLHFHIEDKGRDKLHYISITYLDNVYKVFENEQDSLFVSETTVNNTEQLFNMLLKKLKQANSYDRQRLITMSQKEETMITLTEGQIIYASLITGLVIFILALYIIEKWGKKEKYTLREKTIVPLLAISTLFLASNLLIADLPLNASTITTTTKLVYNGKNADNSTLTQLKHAKANYYDIKRIHYAPTDTRLASALKQPITRFNELILTLPSNENSSYYKDYDIQKVTLKGKGPFISKITLTTHKHIYKNRWSLFARVENTYELTAETTV